MFNWNSTPVFSKRGIADIYQLDNLQEMNLFGNKFSVLPENIGELKNLQILDLGGNQLSTIPVCIAQLSNLRILNLSHNDALLPYNKQLEGAELTAFLDQLAKGTGTK